MKSESKAPVRFEMEKKYVIIKVLPDSGKVLYYDRGDFFKNPEHMFTFEKEAIDTLKKFDEALNDDNVCIYELPRNQLLRYYISRHNGAVLRVFEILNMDPDDFLINGGDDEYEEIFNYIYSGD